MLCHELGHELGLGHRSNDESCMTTTSWKPFTPDGHDYDQLRTQHNHTDSSDSYVRHGGQGSAGVKGPDHAGDGGGGGGGGSRCLVSLGGTCLVRGSTTTASARSADDDATTAGNSGDRVPEHAEVRRYEGLEGPGTVSYVLVVDPDRFDPGTLRRR